MRLFEPRVYSGAGVFGFHLSTSPRFHMMSIATCPTNAWLGGDASPPSRGAPCCSLILWRLREKQKCTSKTNWKAVLCTRTSAYPPTPDPTPTQRPKGKCPQPSPDLMACSNFRAKLSQEWLLLVLVLVLVLVADSHFPYEYSYGTQSGTLQMMWINN